MNSDITLKEVLDKHKDFMIIKKGCPYCKRAHDLLHGKIMEFDHDKYKTLTSQAQEQYKHYTYPLIIKEGEFIGGCSELEKTMK